MDYLAILKHSLKTWNQLNDDDMSEMEFLGSYIFGFTTYETEYCEMFATKALEVCTAIDCKDTFKYIEIDDNEMWYLLMVNMPFFSGKLEWGSSIRGAWWDSTAEFQASDDTLWDGDYQVENLTLNLAQWKEFIVAMVKFADGG